MIQADISKHFPPGPDSAGFHLHVNFEAAAGVTVLFGPSGSGKTLTLDALAGFAVPDFGRILLSGRILFDGQAGVNLPPRERACGYVFQNHALFPHMSLRQNLAFAAHHLPGLERHRRIAELLERFKLTEFAGRFPRELSGGQKQRSSIARALLPNPRALLLDEPGRGLDNALRADLYTAISDIRKSVDLPLLLVTHDLEECLALGDQALIYQAGRIIHRATPLDLLRNPGTAEVARLLGAFNIYEAEVLALDPARQTSRVRMLGEEIQGPHLRGPFKGDRVTLCARPEELRIATKPGENRIRAELVKRSERPQCIRADFGRELIVDVPRESWPEEPGPLWVEVPGPSLRLVR